MADTDPNCPDPSRFQPVALLSEGKLRNVVVLRETDSGRRFVGHRLEVPASIPGETILARVEAEATRLRKLKHPRLPVFDGWVEGGTGPWLLFKYIEGHPLSHYAGHADEVSSDWIAFWLSQTLEALAFLHSLGQAIGGATPSDLVANPQGLTLVDVGILDSMFPESAALARSPARRELMAPEDRYSTQHTPSGDIFSAAAVAYWLACGRAPDNVAQVHAAARVEELLGARPELQSPVAEVVGRLLEFRAQDRFPTAESALDYMAWSVPALAGTPPPPPSEPFSIKLLESPSPLARETDKAPRPLSVKTRPPPEAMSGGTLEVDYGAVPDAPAPSFMPAVSGTIKESMDDVRWTVTHKPAKAVPALLGVAVLLGMGVRTLMSSQAHPPPPARMHVATGSIMVNSQGSQWQDAQVIREPGLIVAAQKSGVTDLAFGQEGHLQLETRAMVRIESMTDSQMAFSVLQGQVSVLMANNVTGTFTQQGSTIVCPPGTSMELAVGSEGVSARVRQGAVTVHGTHTELRVKAGQTAAMGGKHPQPGLEP